MAQQRIIWTVLPHGRYEDGDHAGQLRVSIVASPRLTPEAADQQTLQSFPEWVHWPDTLKNVRFRLRIGAAAGRSPADQQGGPGVVVAVLHRCDPRRRFRVQEHGAGQPALVRRAQRPRSAAHALRRARRPVGRHASYAAAMEGRPSQLERHAHRRRHAHAHRQSRRPPD